MYVNWIGKIFNEAQKKLVIAVWKQCEQLRTLNALQTTNSMRNSMHASTVRALFGLQLPVLHFVADPRTLVCLCINFIELNFQFCFSKCGIKIVRNVTINDVQLQNSNLEFGIPPISYT